jgi:hypothetical protein
MENSISSADEQKPIVVSIRLQGEYQAPKVDTEMASMMMDGKCKCSGKQGQGSGGDCDCGTKYGAGE